MKALCPQFRCSSTTTNGWPASVWLGLLLVVASLSATAGDVAPESKVPPRGEFVLRHQAAIGRDGTDYRKFCTPFTENLNQFRHLDFETCDARLSPKYPQFSRPQWATKTGTKNGDRFIFPPSQPTTP